jgi:NAD(P)H-hydrate epimerase
MAPEYMTVGLPEDADGQVSAEAIDRVLAVSADVMAVGPGLGSGDGVRAFVHGLVDRAGVPLVLDADALNAFAGEHAHLLSGRDGHDIIITPHPGEMARLLNVTTDEVQADRIKAARTFAETHQLHVVLKGHRTLIAAPEGSVAINMTGNPGMATGGTGDVLTGVIAGWFGQLLDAEGAARLGAYLHGHAGDLAMADLGEVALTASDLLTYLGDAVLELSAERTSGGEDEDE